MPEDKGKRKTGHSGGDERRRAKAAGNIGKVGSEHSQGSETRQIIAWMIETQRLETLGQLARGVAHDYNNCLAGVLGYATLLKEMLSGNSEGFGYAAAIEKSARHAADVTAKLLSFARRESSEREPVIVNFIVEESVGLATLSARTPIEADLSRNIPPVTASPGQLQQAVVNLLLAAENIAGTDGKVSVSTRFRAGTKDDGNEGSGEAVVITVRAGDSAGETRGEAVSLSSLKSDAGESAKIRLSLLAACEIVKAHGGDILFQASKGEGGTYTMLIPAMPSELAAQGRREEPLKSEPAPGGGMVLVVDDDGIVRQLVARVLAKSGYRVEEAADAERGEEMLLKTAGELSAIILDMRMPGRPGADFYRRIRDIAGQVPVVICTGFSQESEVTRILSEPNVTLLTKPFTSQELVQAVSQAVSLRCK